MLKEFQKIGFKITYKGEKDMRENIDSNNENATLEIREVLRKFQDGYTKRDIGIIDQYMDELFAKGDEIVIMGTSNGEFCLGYEESKELVKSDWEYWMDVRIDTENARIFTEGNVGWISAQGTLKYKFETSDEKFDSYLNFVKIHFDEKDELDKLPPKKKLTNINMVLSHFMQSRTPAKRQYLWPIRLTGLLTKENGKWKFKYMQFSLPRAQAYPDMKLSSREEYITTSKEDRDKRRKFSANINNKDIEKIKSMTNELQQAYLDIEGNSIEDILLKYFESDNDITFIGTDSTWYIGHEEIKEIISDNRNEWDEILLDMDEAIIRTEANVGWIATTGMVKKNLSDNEAALKEIDNIMNIFNKNISSKEKLFQIQRNIALMINETEGNQEFIWPIRFEGMLVRTEDKWSFHSIQFSFPYGLILEGKYDVPLIEEETN